MGVRLPRRLAVAGLVLVLPLLPFPGVPSPGTPRAAGAFSPRLPGPGEVEFELPLPDLSRVPWTGTRLVLTLEHGEGYRLTGSAVLDGTISFGVQGVVRDRIVVVRDGFGDTSKFHEGRLDLRSTDRDIPVRIRGRVTNYSEMLVECSDSAGIIDGILEETLRRPWELSPPNFVRLTYDFGEQPDGTLHPVGRTTGYGGRVLDLPFGQGSITPGGSGGTVRIGMGGDGGLVQMVGKVFPDRVDSVWTVRMPGSIGKTRHYRTLWNRKWTLTRVAGGGVGDGSDARSASLRPVDICLAPDGSICVADYLNFGIRRIGTDGVIGTIAGNGAPGAAQAGGPATQTAMGYSRGVAAASGGDVYIAEQGTHRVLRVDSGGILHVFAGTGQPGYSGDGGPATAARLQEPVAIAVGPSGEVYIADSGDCRVRKVSAEGTITTVAGNGVPASTGDGGLAVQASLLYPNAVAVGTGGEVFVVDGSVIRRVGADGVITRFAGSGNSGFSGDGGPALEADMDAWDLALDSTGALFVSGTRRIRRIGVDGIIETVAGTGTQGRGEDWMLAVDAPLGYVGGLAVSLSGDLYFGDSENNEIRRVDPDGRLHTIAGFGPPPDGASALDALGQIGTLAAGENGEFYVASGSYGATGPRILRVEGNGLITTMAGGGDPTGDGGPALRAWLAEARDVAVDPGGGLYVLEATRIRRIAPDGTISAFAGGGAASGNGVPALSALLEYPRAIAVSPAGDVLVAEFSGHRIRKIASDGTISTVAGTGASGFSGSGGPATSAAIGDPFDIALSPTGELYILSPPFLLRVGTDGILTSMPGPSGYGMALGPAGEVYVSDSERSRIVRMETDGAISIIAGTGTNGFSGDGGPAVDAQVSDPGGIGVTPAGDVLFADKGNGRIRRIGLDGTISTVATGVGALGSLALGPSGALYCTDTNYYGAGRVLRVDSDGTVSTVAAEYAWGPGPSWWYHSSPRWDGLPGRAAVIPFVGGFARGTSGDLYYTGNDGTIARREADGTLRWMAGIAESGGSADNREGPAKDAALGTPGSIRETPLGEIVFVTKHGRLIRRISGDGTIDTLAGGGESVPGGRRTPATAVDLRAEDFALGSAGEMLIVGDGRILRRDAAGMLTTVAGGRRRRSPGDGGPSSKAGLVNPVSVDFGPQGELYVLDANDGRLRRIDSEGTVTTVFGPVWRLQTGVATYFSDSDALVRVEPSGSLLLLLGGQVFRLSQEP